MYARFLVVALAATLAAGCQTAARYAGDENSPYYIVPAGTRLVLNQPLSFEPEQVSVYIQNGRVMRASETAKYEPFCKFELYNRVGAARTIQPDQITVTRARQHRQDGAFSRLGATQYAGLSFGAVAQMGGSSGDGGVPLLSMLTSMELTSAQQPEIYRLTCLRWAYPPMDEHVTIAEIRRTLSPLFTLRLPGES